MEVMKIAYEKSDKILRTAQFNTLKQAMTFYLKDELKDVGNIHVDFSGEFYHYSMNFDCPESYYTWVKLKLAFNNAGKNK